MTTPTIEPLNKAATKMHDKLRATLEQHAPLAIALSGGVDSMTLAFIAARSNPATEMFHAVSPAVPLTATARVKEYAKIYGWHLQLINAGEMQDPEYQANPLNRCYYCKSNLYSTIARHTTRQIASGTNLDDLQDFRPGLQAAQENAVCHPFVESQIDKNMIRQLAGELGLSDLQELPASPCLSSRVTTGIAIDAKLLPLIDQVEQTLRSKLPPADQGKAVRCRIKEQGLAIQLDPAITMAKSDIMNIVQATFGLTAYSHYTSTVSIETYQQGSAFIKSAVIPSVAIWSGG